MSFNCGVAQSFALLFALSYATLIKFLPLVYYLPSNAIFVAIFMFHFNHEVKKSAEKAKKVQVSYL